MLSVMGWLHVGFPFRTIIRSSTMHPTSYLSSNKIKNHLFTTTLPFHPSTVADVLAIFHFSVSGEKNLKKNLWKSFCRFLTKMLQKIFNYKFAKQILKSFVRSSVHSPVKTKRDDDDKLKEKFLFKNSMHF